MSLVAGPPEWPNVEAYPVAVVRFEPDELVEALGFDPGFVDTVTDLGEAKIASVVLPSGVTVVLLRNRGNHVGGTQLHADSSIPAEVVLAEFLQESGIEREKIFWIREE